MTGRASCRCCAPRATPASRSSGTSATTASRTISTSGTARSSSASPASRRRRQRVVRAETDGVPLYCPVNEISYWAWAGGTVARFNPVSRRRGRRAEAPARPRRHRRRSRPCATVDPRARFVHAEPLINIVAAPTGPRRILARAPRGAVRGLGHAHRAGRAGARRQARLSRHRRPELLSRQPMARATAATIPLGHHLYRPLRELLAESPARYRRPLYLGGDGCGGKCSRRLAPLRRERGSRRFARRACRSRASASTRSSTIPAGRTSGRARLGCSVAPMRQALARCARSWPRSWPASSKC